MQHMQEIMSEDMKKFHTLWSNKSQLMNYRPSDKIVLFPTTILDCEESITPFSISCTKSAYKSIKQIINHFLSDVTMIGKTK